MRAGGVPQYSLYRIVHIKGQCTRLCWNVFLACREFKLSEDMYAHDSIDLLKDSGIDFARNEAQGIDVQRFGELLISSGIVLNDEVSWQHGAWAVCLNAAHMFCRVRRNQKFSEHQRTLLANSRAHGLLCSGLRRLPGCHLLTPLTS